MWAIAHICPYLCHVCKTWRETSNVALTGHLLRFLELPTTSSPREDFPSIPSMPRSRSVFSPQSPLRRSLQLPPRTPRRRYCLLGRAGRPVRPALREFRQPATVFRDGRQRRCLPARQVAVTERTGRDRGAWLWLSDGTHCRRVPSRRPWLATRRVAPPRPRASSIVLRGGERDGR